MADVPCKVARESRRTAAPPLRAVPLAVHARPASGQHPFPRASVRRTWRGPRVRAVTRRRAPRPSCRTRSSPTSTPSCGPYRPPPRGRASPSSTASGTGSSCAPGWVGRRPLVLVGPHRPLRAFHLPSSRAPRDPTEKRSLLSGVPNGGTLVSRRRSTGPAAPPESRTDLRRPPRRAIPAPEWKGDSDASADRR